MSYSHQPGPHEVPRNQDVISQDRLAGGPSSSSSSTRNSFEDLIQPSTGAARHQREGSQNGLQEPAKRPPPPRILTVAPPSSVLGEEDDPLASATADDPRPVKDEPVTWMSLPKKSQLAVLTLARLSEPLAERSLAAYLFYQLRSFDPTLSDSAITSQGGIFTAAFAAAQFLTAVWWGRAADTPWIGRKRVLMVGLLGTCMSSLGVGFSRSFGAALCWRVLAGMLNGNVGVMRTMINEIIKEKKYQSRAFLLLPMCFNIGVVIGPIVGGFLADPIKSFPSVFGPGSFLGGKEGVGWMTTFPYALPNVVNAVLVTMSALGVILGLDETHPALREKPDYGRRVGKYLARVLFRRGEKEYEYARLPDAVELTDTPTAEIHDEEDVESSSVGLPKQEASPISTPSFRGLFTQNVVLTLLAHHFLAFHISTFNTLVFLFLPAPKSNNEHKSLPFRFTGGLGLSSDRVGLAAAIIGVIGFPLQIFVYPAMNTKLGTLPSYRWFLPFSIVAYAIMPFTALLPGKPYLMWPSITIVLALQVISRTFSLPGATILVNNCTPHPAMLGTVHGLAQSVSSAARMLGPTLGGWGLGLGLSNNFVGAIWWFLGIVALLNWFLLFSVWEGDGGVSAVSK